MKTTSEAAFETAIESVLLAGGCARVAAQGDDRERALFPDETLAFIRATQGKVWDTLEALHGEQTGAPIIITTLQKFPFVSGQLMKPAEERGEGSDSHLARRWW